MSDQTKLEELRKQLAAMEAVEAALTKHGGTALKADWDYTSQRKATLKAEIRQAERDILLAGITTPEQAVEQLTKDGHLPLRILLRKSEDGRYQGEVEHSFSLSWELDKVGVYWSGTAHSFLGPMEINAVKGAEHQVAEYAKQGQVVVAYDPLSADCPVDVDILVWVKAFMGGRRAGKFDKRNAPMRQKA